MELISVIIPAYNTEKFIEHAIDSVIAQTYSNIEIIVADDGSADATAAVARRKLEKDFKGPWQVIELGVNRGVNVARNVAWRAARGSWIQSLDSDDFLAPTKFEKQMAVCASASDRAALVYSPRQCVYVEGGRIEPTKPNARPSLVYQNKAPVAMLGNDGYLIHQAGLLRREAMEQVGGFDEHMKVFEEVDLLIRIANEGWTFEFVPSDHPLYYWRFVRGQARMGDEGARYNYIESALSWMHVALKATRNQPLSAFDLTPHERWDVLDSLTGYARGLHSRDRKIFREYMVDARRLVPDFVPTEPWYLAALTRCIGYENAEEVAEFMRKPRAAIFGSLGWS